MSRYHNTVLFQSFAWLLFSIVHLFSCFIRIMRAFLVEEQKQAQKAVSKKLTKVVKAKTTKKTTKKTAKKSAKTTKKSTKH